MDGGGFFSSAVLDCGKDCNMKTLSIDIETYSDIDLQKCGVYKYASSPSFEILLFGYSVDGGEIHVVDLAQGDEIPVTIIKALTDENVIKWAFNAQFERVCLSRYLAMPVGDYLSSESWHCSMVWSAYMGLPLSLESVGAVLKLDSQKLKEGKELIKYFCGPCSPTKVNLGRTRNLPSHAQDRWDLFKAYNKRDIEVEMAIQAKLARYPVPDSIWNEYNLDQEINDRGVKVDIALVNSAVQMDEKSRLELTTAMKEFDKST